MTNPTSTQRRCAAQLSLGDAATLTLTNGKIRYATHGEVSPDSHTGTPSFSIDIDLDANTLRHLLNSLLPVLEGNGPIQLTIGAYIAICRCPDSLPH